MKKIGLCIALSLVLSASVACTALSNEISPSLPDKISPECYDETVHLVDQYYSEEFQTQISEIYSDFGKDNYDAQFVTKDMDEIDREILADFVNLYNRYDTKEEKLLIVYGYNFIKLCELQYENSSMNTSIDHSSDIEVYYENLISAPSDNSYNLFKDYIIDNKIFTFEDSLELTNEKEIAEMISEYLSNMTIQINACTKMLKVDFSTAALRYSEAMKSLSGILEILDLYPNLRANFTSMSIIEIQGLITNSQDNLANENVELFISNFDQLCAIVDELSTNTTRIIQSADSENNLLIKHSVSVSLEEKYDTTTDSDVSGAFDNELISNLSCFNMTYRDLELNPDDASNTKHTKYKLGIVNFLGEENTAYIWIANTYNAYPSSIEIIGSANKRTMDELRVNLQKHLHTKAYDCSDTHFIIDIPETDLMIEIYSLYQDHSNQEIYIKPKKDESSSNGSDDSTSEESNTLEEAVIETTEKASQTEYENESVTSSKQESTTSSDNSTGYGLRYR